MKISKQRLACLLFNALEMIDEMGADLEDINNGLGITEPEMLAIYQGNVEDVLTDEERYKIAREVDRESKLQDIVYRLMDMESDSPCLNGFTPDEVIDDKGLLDEILRRYEKAEGWVDNSDYWYLIDDCIKDVLKIERSMKK